MNRIRWNYAEYREHVTALDADEIFNMASEIAATNTVHALMTGRIWFSETEAAYLLIHENPLEVLADCWRCYMLCNGPDFEAFICEYAAGARQYYEAKATVIRETLQKYGIIAILYGGVISDVIDMCSRLLPASNCFNNFAKGGGFCPKG